MMPRSVVSAVRAAAPAGRALLAALGSGLLAGAILLIAGGLQPSGRSGEAAQAIEAALGPGGIGVLTPGAEAGFAGSASCAGCHAAEVKAWLSSQHSGAMSLPEPQTVRGDFSDVRVGPEGASARFFRDGARYMVELAGRDGAPTVFPIAYTFGLEPLQQYLVAMPDGRIQALPFAYDTRPAVEGGQRWFHLYGDHPPPVGDPLHWTGPQQNWNHMCAECHSTAVRKGYDAASDTFQTRFSEISVGCESCHGPAVGHVAWARQGGGAADALKGFAARAAVRPPVDWTPDPATGSPAHGVPHPLGDGVETCARCHARRGIFSEGWMPGQALTDTHTPVLLDRGLFEADGQNLDEVFNDHAFKQSLMYQRGVTCTDCHDPHSARLKAPGAEVCGQCHMPDRFATQAHTGHAPGPKAPDCISCHMPQRTYMVIDGRHDHSFRIPRPDLSARAGTPNACTDCHADKPASWAAEAIARWHGPVRKGFQIWGPAFHDARLGAASARDPLMALAANPAVPGLVRATAVGELAALPSRASDAVVLRALKDPDPTVRASALRAQAGLPLAERWRRASAFLDDPSPMVRLEAAELLSDQRPDALAGEERARLQAAFAAYEAAQRSNADRADARANLGVFLQRQGDAAGAEREFLAGVKLDPTAAALRINLADLYRALGRENEAERVLRDGLARQSDAALHHALGLSLVRQKRYPEAMAELKAANVAAPDDATYAYVLAVALNQLGQPAEAARVIAAALRRMPNDPRLLGLALNGALQERDLAQARDLGRRLLAVQPDNGDLARLVGQLEASPGRPGLPGR